MPYFYQHTNGSIIEKPDRVVDFGGGPSLYFDSPFVRDWWWEPDDLRPLRTPPPPQQELNIVQTQSLNEIAILDLARQRLEFIASSPKWTLSAREKARKLAREVGERLDTLAA